MSVLQVLQYNGPIIPADTSATANSLAYRDSSGGIAGVNVSGSNLQSTGTVQTPAPVTFTTTATVAAASPFYKLDTTSAGFTTTLPAASTVSGMVFIFIKIIAANTATLKGNGSELIDGSNTTTLTSQYTSKRVISDGTQWWSF